MLLLATTLIALTILSNASASHNRSAWIHFERNDLIPCEVILDIFDEWINEAKNCSKIHNATLMALSTSTRLGKPSIAVLNLSEYSPDGFMFHANKYSQTGKELKHNRQAAMLFYWAAIHKMIRLEGKVKCLRNNGSLVESSEETKPTDDEDSESKGLKMGCGKPMREDWSLYRFKPTAIEFTEVGEDGMNATSHLYIKATFHNHDNMWKECS